MKKYIFATSKSKRELQKIAKKVVTDALATAYYKFSDRSDYYDIDPNSEEYEYILDQISKYAIKAQKFLGSDPYTY